MRIPTAARADEINSVAVVLDYRASVFEVEFVQRASGGLLWQHNVKSVVSPARNVLPANILILKKSECIPVCVRDRLYFEKARKLQIERAFAADQAFEFQNGIGGER